MKTCAFCKEQMQDAATACPHCGKPAGAALVATQVISVVFLLIVALVVGFFIYAYSR